MFRLFLIFVLVPSLAFADLGDTPQSARIKYGVPSATGSPQILTYVHGKYRIWQTYDDTGHCVIAEFSPLDHAAPYAFANGMVRRPLGTGSGARESKRTWLRKAQVMRIGRTSAAH